MDSQNTHTCHHCEESVPNASDFCPFCGTNQRRLTTPLNALEAVLDQQKQAHAELQSTVVEPIRALEPRYTALTPSPFSSLDDEWDWEEEFDPHAGRKRAIAGVAIAISLVAVLITSFMLFQQASDTPEVASAIVAETEVEKTELEEAVDPPVETKKALGKAIATTADGTTRIQIGEHSVAEIATHKGSRYDSVDERANAVVVRFNHVLTAIQAETPKRPIFVSRTNGDRSEVAWQNPNGSYFRVLDVTKNDVKAWSKKNKTKTSAHILSNLLADQLNAFVESYDLERS